MTDSPEVPEDPTCVCGKTFKKPPHLDAHINAKKRAGDRTHAPVPVVDSSRVDREYAEQKREQDRPHYRIPVHPQPSFFETTEVITEEGRVGSERIREILYQSEWSPRDLYHRATESMVEKGWVRVFDIGRNYSVLVSSAVAKRLEADPMKPEGLRVSRR